MLDECNRRLMRNVAWLPGKSEEDAPWRVYFRKEIFAPWYSAKSDPVAAHLIYKQICRGIRSGEYACRSVSCLVGKTPAPW